LEKRGWSYKDLNELGLSGCTLHYDVQDMAVNKNMSDWIPQWCFYFLKRALEKHGGRSSLKLDWFTGKDVRVAPTHPPKTIHDLKDAEGRLSDHDAIVVDFVPQTSGLGEG
jgi:hypothetical protein